MGGGGKPGYSEACVHSKELGFNFNCRRPLEEFQWESNSTGFIFLNNPGPDCCSSVDLAQACEAKGHHFDSQSGLVPGLQARSPVGGKREAITH